MNLNIPLSGSSSLVNLSNDLNVSDFLKIPSLTENNNTLKSFDFSTIISKANENETESNEKVLNKLTREETNTYNLSVDAAMKLKIPFVSSDSRMNRIVFIQEYSKYEELEVSKTLIRKGIAVRWIIDLKKLNANAKISTLESIAASAELNLVEGNVSFQVIGISSSEITKLMPNISKFDMNTYKELSKSLQQVKQLIWDKKITVKPEIISIEGQICQNKEDSIVESVSVYKALESISNKKSIDTSHRKTKNIPLEIYKDVYLSICDNNELNYIPTKEDAKKAKQKMLCA